MIRWPRGEQLRFPTETMSQVHGVLSDVWLGTIGRDRDRVPREGTFHLKVE
jgi:hypothetical protein